MVLYVVISGSLKLNFSGNKLDVPKLIRPEPKAASWVLLSSLMEVFQAYTFSNFVDFNNNETPLKVTEVLHKFKTFNSCHVNKIMLYHL